MEKRLFLYTIALLVIGFFFANIEEKIAAETQESITANALYAPTSGPALGICSATSIKVKLETAIKDIKIEDILDIQDYNAFVIVGRKISTPNLVVIYVYNLGNNKQLEFGNDDWFVLIDTLQISGVNISWKPQIEAITSLGNQGTILLWAIKDNNANNMYSSIVHICTIEKKCNDKQMIISYTSPTQGLENFLPIAASPIQPSGVYMYSYDSSNQKVEILFCEFASGGGYPCLGNPPYRSVIATTYFFEVLRDLGVIMYNPKTYTTGLFDASSETFFSYSSLGLIPFPSIHHPYAGGYLFSARFVNGNNDLLLTSIPSKQTTLIESFQELAQCFYKNCFMVADGGKLRVVYKGYKNNYKVKEVNKPSRMFLDDKKYTQSGYIDGFVRLNNVQLIEYYNAFSKYDILLPYCPA